MAYRRVEYVLHIFLMGDSYVYMLQNFIVDNLPFRIMTSGYFLQDGAPPHYSLTIRHCLDETFVRRWIGIAGPLTYPARSIDLTPCDFWLWGMVKDRVTLMTLNNP